MRKQKEDARVGEERITARIAAAARYRPRKHRIELVFPSRLVSAHLMKALIDGGLARLIAGKIASEIKSKATPPAQTDECRANEASTKKFPRR